MAKETYNPYGMLPCEADEAHIGWYPVATTQTLAKGDPVILSSGQVAVAAVTSAAHMGVMAEASVLATAGTLVPVYDDPHQEFFIRADGSVAAVEIGYEFDLAGSTGVFVADANASTYNALIFLGVKTGDTSSEIGCHCRVRFHSHQLS